MLKTNAMIGVATAALSLSPLAGMAADVQAAVASIMPQQQTKSMHVRGIVRDAQGEPLIGVSVVPSDDQKQGVITNMDGQYDIVVKGNTTLRFSYVGFATQTVKVVPGGQFDIKLVEDNDMMDEVVVVGYGTMKKSDLTGSTTSLRNEAITSVMAANPIESLQGKSSGVAVFTNNQPGEAPTLRIRGSASINAGTDPLYVVDGFALTDGNMNGINPADIESMEILKDASATAIYGSRGANGVVMITTKKGSKGKHNITAHANLGVQMRSRLIETISGQEFIDYINKANVAQGGTAPFPNGYNGPFYDWQKALINSSALTQDYGVTLDGMSGETRYMFSAGYYDQDGLLDPQGYEKFTAHTNLDHKFNKWFSLGANMQFTSSRQNIMTDPVTNDVFRSGWPTDLPKNDDGSWNIIQHGEVFNPFADMAATSDNIKNLRFIGNFYAQVDFSKHFNYKLNIGYDTKTTNQYRFLDSQTAKGIQSNSTTGSGLHKWARQESRLMDNILTYSNQWGDHRMSLTGVYSWQDYKYRYSQMSGNFSNNALGAWNFASADQASIKVASDIYSNKLISWTARGTYAYKDRYMLTATIRFDGSSRFGSDSKWGTFPSVGLAWRASEEDFLKGNKVITDLKIRGSYGVTGNQEIGNYNAISTLGAQSWGYIFGGEKNTVVLPQQYANTDLKWESTSQTDIGLDFGFLNNRIHGSIDWYYKKTKDLLLTVAVPSPSLITTQLANVGAVRNTGVEFELGFDIMRTKDFSWDATLNFASNKNKLTSLSNSKWSGDDVLWAPCNGAGLAGQYSQLIMVGEPLGTFYGKKFIGLDENGMEKYANDGKSQIIGCAQPDFTYGITTNLRYKNWSLSLNFRGSQGNDVYNNTANNFMYLNSLPGRNVLAAAVNSGISVNQTKTYSSQFIEDGSFFRLDNLTLGYDFKLPVLKITSARAYFTAQNLFCITGYDGLDPEVNTDTQGRGGSILGVDYLSYPRSRTFIFGVNVTF